MCFLNVSVVFCIKQQSLSITSMFIYCDITSLRPPPRTFHLEVKNGFKNHLTKPKAYRKRLYLGQKYTAYHHIVAPQTAAPLHTRFTNKLNVL